ncbi:mitochondrial inner membrane protease subunit [Haematococcus lacustris]|uniref:Mitochondrial inner membrane protease subunit n=1 Tax=Haematococcus lacustris TaxID=44745 RepID=A0A699ZE95_HAELA|nr:mitochondrial inner membrane protease subunit [Haematococcus lacustris]
MVVEAAAPAAPAAPAASAALVPVGHVWIQGDNLLHSLDSRVYGPVPAALLRGRVLYQAGPG